MKYVSKLTEAELTTLESAHKNHPISRVRMRAHVIILSFEGRQIKDITKICRISRYAVSRVINRWEENGFRGLFDKPRSGRAKSLTAEDEDFIHKMVEEDPRSVKKIISVLEDQRGKKVSRSTVKRAIKKKRVWKRIRKSLKSKRDEKHFRRTQDRINSLEQRRLTGEIDIFYFDEAGFDLTPCVPYAWQPKNEYIEVPPAKSQRLNTLAFMDKDNACTPYVFECNINSDVVISCFDKFSETITKKTFVILDNAPVHKSKKFLSRLPEWHKKGLYLKFLPKYSPELNLIEILWRKIKYEWLPFEAYTSFRELAEWLDYILLNFGSQYIIEFS
jgi:transposase